MVEHHLERTFLIFSIALYQITNSLHHFSGIFFLEAVAHSLTGVLIESVQVACHFGEVISPHLQLMENLGFCKLARGNLGNDATNHHPNNHGWVCQAHADNYFTSIVGSVADEAESLAERVDLVSKARHKASKVAFSCFLGSLNTTWLVSQVHSPLAVDLGEGSFLIYILGYAIVL